MIILNQGDYEYFIKRQFQANIVMGFFIILLIVTMDESNIKIFLLFLSTVYVIAVLFFYLKLRKSHHILSYALHRMLGQMFLSVAFFIIALVLVSLISNIYFICCIFLYLALCILFLVMYKKVNKENYFNVLSEKYNSIEKNSLYGFFMIVSTVKNKEMSGFLYLFISIFSLIFAVLIVLCLALISDELGLYLIVFTNIILGVYVLWNLFFNTYITYSFLKKICK